MYDFFVGLHNLLRWVVVLGGVAAIVTAVRGLVANAPWDRATQVSGLVFTSALGAQLLLGLGLYGFSPYLRALMNDAGAVMANDQTRFFAVEHITVMILALIVAQAGYSLSKRAAGDRAKYVRAAAGYVVAGVLIAYGIPWWRSLIPWG